MSKLDVIVKLDDRVRLLSAVIAATNYPEYAQKIKPHGWRWMVAGSGVGGG
jgi:hypothetical protein